MNFKFLLLATLCTIVLSACGTQSPSNTNLDSSSDPETTTESNNSNGTEASTFSQATTKTSVSETVFEKNDKNTVDFKTLMELIGKSDSNVVSVLGGGDPLTNDDSVLLNRDYTLSLFNEDVSVSLAFNLYQHKANLLDQCTIYLTKPDLDGYKKILVGLLGTPSETYEKSYFFETSTATVLLADPFDDVPYIEISPNKID